MPPTYEDEGMRAAVEMQVASGHRGARPLAARREPLRARARQLGRRLRLPAEGPRARRGRVPRSRRARGGWGLGARSRGSREAAARAAAEDDVFDGLTPREREVLGLVAEGRTNASIAKHLWLTENSRDARALDPGQARPAAGRRHAPARPRSRDVPPRIDRLANLGTSTDSALVLASMRRSASSLLASTKVNRRRKSMSRRVETCRFSPSSSSHHSRADVGRTRGRRSVRHVHDDDQEPGQLKGSGS